MNSSELKTLTDKIIASVEGCLYDPEKIRCECESGIIKIIRMVRAQALEEAAQICDGWDYGVVCAKEIRELAREERA